LRDAPQDEVGGVTSYGSNFGNGLPGSLLIKASLMVRLARCPLCLDSD
jgi:hypothetical protein